MFFNVLISLNYGKNYSERKNSIMIALLIGLLRIELAPIWRIVTCSSEPEIQPL